MYRIQAITEYLSRNTHKDLAELYTPDMEVQVNVSQDGGERIEGTYNNINWVGYTDGFETWKSFRIPHNADTIPTYEDRPLTFSATHFDSIGLTGWDWRNLLSRWVAFDFDAITGHSSKHSKKLTNEELSTIQRALENVPWVTIRKSSSGKGLHIYVFLQPVRTCNHREHAALARAILGKLSFVTNIDLQARVDTCGGNIWICTRRSKGTDGLNLVKQGEILEDIPHNWTLHLDVVGGKRTRVRQVSDDFYQSKLEELANKKVNHRFDETHKLLLTWLAENKRYHWWDADAYMLVTHTVHLRDAHRALGFTGIFDTNSDGMNLNEQNCFAFPLRNGAWAVRRYTMGTEEHASWLQDGAGWTTCYLNKEPTFRDACVTNTGIEDEKGNFNFLSGEDMQRAMLCLGADVKLAPNFLSRRCSVKRHKDGRVIVQIPKNEGDNHPERWLDDKKYWTRIYDVKRDPEQEPDMDADAYDDYVRHVVTKAGGSAGWAIKSDDTWIVEPLQHAKMALEALGLKTNDVKMIMGTNVLRPWTLVVRPFEPEYPGGRLWNRSAPQLRYKPKMEGELHFPHWKKILSHIGASLDPYIQINDWCIENNINNGEEYLLCWIASLLQFPFEPLPYLFIYGEEQNTGKSIFHEALQTLFSPGFTFAETALTNPSKFNGELENAVLCVIEEKDLNTHKAAYDRLKEWVTSPILSIHHKRETPYLAPNTTHWVHCTNHRSYCPIFPGDTRITMLRVGSLAAPIPKRHLLNLLDKEAPDFLGALLQLKLPESNDRLMVPVIETDDKLQASDANRTSLDAFINEHCHYVPGCVVVFSEFYDKFITYLSPQERGDWTKVRVSKMLSSKYPRGRLTSSPAIHIGNLAWTLDQEPYRKGELGSFNNTIQLKG